MQTLSDVGILISSLFIMLRSLPTCRFAFSTHVWTSSTALCKLGQYCFTLLHSWNSWVFFRKQSVAHTSAKGACHSIAIPCIAHHSFSHNFGPILQQSGNNALIFGTSLDAHANFRYSFSDQWWFHLYIPLSCINTGVLPNSLHTCIWAIPNHPKKPILPWVPGPIEITNNDLLVSG